MEETPYVGFGNDTLNQRPPLRAGEEVVCPHCNQKHPVEQGTTDGAPTDLLLFIRCGSETYLAGIKGRSILGIKADVSGSFDPKAG